MAERQFELDELFISTTDRKGHIRLSNSVFVRVSGYEESELHGAAHNIIRHPDMPRAVFKVFWDLLQAGTSVAAYVKNRAKDPADHYWVMAIVAPVPGGFASVRIKPSHPELLGAVSALYADLVALEHEVEAGDVRNRKASIAASQARLVERLRALGFADYEAFMRHALVAEMTSRETLLAGARAAEPATLPDGANPRVAEVHARCVAMRRFLDSLVDDVASYAETGARLAGKSAFVRELSEDMRLFSLNAMLASSRLADGAALSAVASLQRARFDALDPLLHALAADINDVVALLGDMGFRIAGSRIQTEMMAAFAHEHVGDERISPALAAQLELLTHALCDAVEELSAALAALDTRVKALAQRAAELDRGLQVVRALEVNGRIEAARANDTEHVRMLFTEIGGKVEAAREEIAGFAEVRRVLQRDATVERRASEHVTALQQVVRALG